MATEPLPDESLDAEMVVEGLLRFGMKTADIAVATNLPEHRVEKIAKFSQKSKTFSTRLNPQDKELADAMRSLAWDAYREARLTLLVGAPAEKNALTRAIIGRSMALIGAEKDTRLEELREDFTTLLDGVRGTAEYEEIDLPTDDPNVFAIDAVSRDADDSN